MLARHLAVRVDHGSQQLPGATPAVHAHHAQDLEEAKAPQCRGSEDVSLAASRDHGHRGDEHDDVCEEQEANERAD